MVYWDFGLRNFAEILLKSGGICAKIKQWMVKEHRLRERDLLCANKSLYFMKKESSAAAERGFAEDAAERFEKGRFCGETQKKD